MLLTDIIVRNIKSRDSQYKLFDKKGLFLLITNSGRKYWRMKYRFDGREKLLSFGVYPVISLKEARSKRDDAHKQIKQGIDPSPGKKINRLISQVNLENSFENIAREWYEKKHKLTASHNRTILKRLESDIFPFIGSQQINQITTAALLTTIQKIRRRGAVDLANAVLQASGQIFRYAIATSRAEHDITADLKLALVVRKKINHHNWRKANNLSGKTSSEQNKKSKNNSDLQSIQLDLFQ